MFMPLLRPFESVMKICLYFALFGAFILHITTPVIGQSRIPSGFKAKIDWYEKESGQSGYFFPGAIVDDPDGLPRFVYRVRLDRFQHNPAYRISGEDVSQMTDYFLSDLSSDGLSGDWKISTRVSDGGGEKYAIVTILPLRLRNGMVERLDSFTLIPVQGDQSPQPRSGGGGLIFAEHSALAEGTWYKLAIARDGVYRIDRNLLNQLGVDLTTLNPQQINIYGNGGELLPSDNSVYRHDDLQKNAIVVSGEQDGTFDSGDYILFYGKGPDSWSLNYSDDLERSRWTHQKHYYSDSAYYFLRVDDPSPSRISQGPVVNLPETHVSTRFQDYQYIENDLYNLVKSGREFYGDEFDVNTSANYSFPFPGVTTDPASVDFSGVSRSNTQTSSFKISPPGTSETITIATVGTSPTSAAGRVGNASISFTPSGTPVSVGVNYQKGNPDAVGWLDYIAVNVTRQLNMVGNQMRFRDTLGISPGGITRYQLGQSSTVFQVWDITDNLHPVNTPFTLTGTTAEWKSETSQLREFIAFTNAGYLLPTPKGRVLNQDLHALSTPDLMIITAPLLYSAAEELAAIHSEEGLSVAIATPMQIFNEYSSGNPDVTAFRMLMKMFYDRAQGDPALMPKNLLLFGDGNYLNNKGVDAHNDYAVMVFESSNSLVPTTSYVSDDYFVMLSDDDTESPTGLLDCGVGRIPAGNMTRARDYVGKVRRYIAENSTSDGGAYCLGAETSSPFGPWRNIITFVSDDQDGNGAAFEQVHLNSSEFLADKVHEAHPEYDIAKIYMDAYNQESTPGGERYPEGEEAIRQRVQNGTLIITYIGHGGERGWAHERILDIPTIENWTNASQLSVFLTATCELARYDDPGFYSAGEILVMNPQGGAIAMLTTTRIVFSGENFAIDTAFFRVALDEANIPDLTLGKINQLTKNGVSVGNDSKPNFSLLGDPALKMTYPRHKVFTSKINQTDVEVFTDTLKSLQEVEISGYIGDANGNKLTDFSGFVYPTVYDKETQVLTQNNDGGIVQQFQVFNKSIYRGKASVTGGDFTFRFVVPYDINYSIGNGRISYYAVAGSVDAHGEEDDFLIGSSLNDAELNTVGPDINVFMNDESFIAGGTTDESPILFLKLADENGINTVGNGIGHDLTAIFDGDNQNPIVLNDFYEADLDTYKSGTVRYQLQELTPGNHNVKVKAWDIHNNSSEVSVDFVVAESADIALNHVLNYPNPFTTSTSFFFEHNQVCEELNVRIQIFTVGGKLVRTLNRNVTQSGFRSEPIHWDGTDDFGDRIGKGVYVYKLDVRNSSGQRAEKFEKLVILK